MTGPRPRFACPACERIVPGVRDRQARGVAWLLSRHRLILRDGDTITGDGGVCPGSGRTPDHTPVRDRQETRQ